MDFDALFTKELRKKKRKKKATESTNDQIQPTEIIDTAPETEQTTDEIAAVADAIDNEVLEKTWNEMGGVHQTDTTVFRGLSKEQKLALLSEQISSEEKKHTYKRQLDLEAATDPILILDEVTDPQSTDKLYLQLRKYLKSVINEWETDLELSPDRQQSRILYETKRDVVPLLYKLRAHKLKPEMVVTLATITYHLQNNQFLHANESYLKLSIGNVAWPIGVQNVGIHARSASLRIEGKSANIMISNTTRKWITAVKRLITFSERHYNAINTK